MKFNRLLILLIAITTDSFSDFSAKIDRSVIDVNETLKLELVLDKQVFSGQPDIKNLSENFEVLSNNRQQSFLLPFPLPAHHSEQGIQIRRKQGRAAALRNQPMLPCLSQTHGVWATADDIRGRWELDLLKLNGSAQVRKSWETLVPVR